MSKKKNSAAAETPAPKSGKEKTGKKPLSRGGTALFIAGLLLAAVALFLLISVTSFLVSGDADSSLLDEAAKSASAAAGEAAPVSNNGGSWGVRVADYLVNCGFGLSTYFGLLLLALVGVRMMKPLPIVLHKWVICLLFAMLWGSLFCGYALSPLFETSYINPGGQHGTNVAEWLVARVGDAGTMLLLLVTLLVFLIYLTRKTIDCLRKLLSLPVLGVKRGCRAYREKMLERRRKKAEQEAEEADDEAEEEPAGDDAADEVASPAVAASGETEEPGTADAPELSGGEAAGEEPDDGVDAPVALPAAGEIPFEIDGATETPAELQPEDIYPFHPDGDEETADEADEEPAGEGSRLPSDKIELVIEEGGTEEDGPCLENMQPYNPRLDLEYYKFPTLDLLNAYDDNTPAINMEEQNANKDRIINVLHSFGIEISSIKASVGPTITLYEITPAPGVRISKIRNLEDDIALSLSALGIRIIAPIPGKGTIGIEVPNSKKLTVSMQSVIGSKKYQETTMDLPVALGKTITNEVFMVDLCKMPHLLVAGATGMGKSVGLNALITSLIYKKHPSELKFVMIDPKKVEFSVYEPIEKHFLAKLPDGEDAIITDVTQVIQTLNSLCVEMDSRYVLLKNAHVRTLKEYNEKFKSRQLNPQKGHRYLPYIVVIIDEFGDLIMTAGKEIELPIARIAQLARAVGIHMVIATQRPTTNIITGTIKANFPARMAFRVAAMMDSRTILDRPGANQLIGRGDMLFLTGSEPVRVQCAFVDTPEVEKICSYVSRQQAYPTAYYLPEYVEPDGDKEAAGNVDMDRLDPLFEEAARLIVVHQQGSTSLIQRKFSIGYNRAGRLMDQLEVAGVVGPAEGSKPRQVFCVDENDLMMRIGVFLKK